MRWIVPRRHRIIPRPAGPLSTLKKGGNVTLTWEEGRAALVARGPSIVRRHPRMDLAQSGRHRCSLRRLCDPLFAGFLGDLHPPHAADGVDRGGAVVPRIADTRAGLAARARPPFRLRLLWRSSRLPAY